MPTGKMSTEACILQTTPGPYLQVLGGIWRQMMAHHICLWEAVRIVMKNHLDITFPSTPAFTVYPPCKPSTLLPFLPSPQARLLSSLARTLQYTLVHSFCLHSCAYTCNQTCALKAYSIWMAGISARMETKRMDKCILQSPGKRGK